VSTRRRPGNLTVSRDTLSFIGGWYLMIFQAQFAAEFNLAVFLGGMVISGIPGALQAASLLTGRTPEPSQRSPEAASSEASPS
jgi:hypothetical protein